MSDPVAGTRGQTPDDVRNITPLRTFEAGEPVPGLSSWVLERKLGGGGFGEVWLARHAWDAKQKPRAVKFCIDPAAKHRLVTHERNVVVRVMKYAGEHPNIVPLLDCNLDGEVPWLMYEFVEGGTLAKLIEQWRVLPLGKRLGRAVRTLHALSGALAACHRLDPPLVHRDMKPQNVLMAGDVPRITDFGIGSVVIQPDDNSTGAITADAARLPSHLHAAGTRLYAPPEQMLGAPPNPRDDVYALGIIAYQMMFGDLTSAPGTDANLELYGLEVPDELRGLILRSVAMNPDRRPTDAGEWEIVLAEVERARKRPDTDDHATDPAPVRHDEGDRSQPVAEAARVIDARSASLLESTEKPARTTQPSEPSVGHSAHRPGLERPRAKRASARVLLVSLVIGVTLVGAAIGFVIEWLPLGNRAKSKQEPEPQSGDTRLVEIAPGVKMLLCWVPKGECQLGSPKDERDSVLRLLDQEKEPDWLTAEAWRLVFKTDGFWMGQYEVTQEEWSAVMGENPSWFNGANENNAKRMNTRRFPVENVSWNQICGKGKYEGNGFMDKINAYGGIQKAFGKSGRFRLPHEDEWEYAARASSDNDRPFYWGKELNGTQANIDGEFPFGTPAKGTVLARTCAVDATDDTRGRSYAVHPWGLMHMHGNVCEWCDNIYAGYSRVRRGGSWNDGAQNSRAAYRNHNAPDVAHNFIGFRVVLSVLP